MRTMPLMQNTPRSTLTTSAFTGLNNNEIIADGEMHDMKNMSGLGYPLLTLRKKRGISSYDVEGQEPVPLTGIHGRDQLVYVRGDTVYYNFSPVENLTVSTASSMNPKQIVSFGAYVLIFPDKKYFNTADQSDYGSIDRLWSAAGTGVTLSMCRGDGTDYDVTSLNPGNVPPSNPQNNTLWLDESGDNDVLRKYDSLTEEWIEVATTYVKIAATNIGAGLKEYDCVDISGLELADDTNVKLAEQVSMLNVSSIVYYCGSNYIVVAGLLSETVEAGDLTSTTVHADLTMPDMDYIVESNNRLWGCKYGLVNGSVVNEIYASKLGDFKNWRCYMGISTDSYTASVGTDGPFTGAVTQRGYPVFFKENCIHRVSGMTPSSFQIQTTMCRGVQRGSGKSLAVVQENVYYKAREAVMMYDGNMPVSISEKLGETLYSDARAGVLNDIYYISMMDENGDWHLFNYDTTHDNWWAEDNAHALGFGTAEDELFYIDEENNTLVAVRGSVGTAEADFDWRAVFDLYGVNSSGFNTMESVRNEKYVSLFKIRMNMGAGAYMQLWISYNNGEWEMMGERTGTGLGTFVLPVIPKRCDHIRFKLEGSGDAAIYSISRMMEVGGDG